MSEARIREQIAYYRARAGEYDEWFLRQGRYDRGPASNAAWFEEVEEIRKALRAFHASGDVLELAGGTGIWTQELSEMADTLTVVDSSPEVIAINQDRLEGRSVTYEVANIFTWKPQRRFDVVFFSFWLSHVPPELFDEFWQKVRSALKPMGRVFLIDSLLSETSSAVDHKPDSSGEVSMLRRLNNGAEFQIVKVFYDVELLAARLEKLGWAANFQSTTSFFFFGNCRVTRS